MGRCEMTQPYDYDDYLYDYDEYLNDCTTKFSVGGFVIRWAGDNLTLYDVRRGWTAGYRDAVHRAVFRRRGEALDAIQARALDLFVTRGSLSRADLYKGVISLAGSRSLSGSPAKTVHESLKKIVLGGYRLIDCQSS